MSGESYRSNAHIDPLIKPRSFDFYRAVYLPPGTDVRNPLVSPLYGELAGLPPILLQVGDAELLRDDSVQFARRARTAGVAAKLELWPGMPHVFMGFAPLLPQAQDAIAGIGAFLRRCAA